jgi:hypothetical protein
MREDQKRDKINRALDAIQEKYGPTAILPGRLVEKKD